MTLTPGTRIGPYELLGPLGAGGMGEVYRARDPRLARDVAIKVLPPGVAGDPDRRARFEREARAVAALSHPNILALFDVGTDGDQHFVVTELLDGETLAERLQQGGLPIRRATEIAVAIARGLSAAHGKGIAHRDLKPANVFLLDDGQVKILDFGLARRAESAAPGVAATEAALTDPGGVLGTAGYMAPEQVRGQAVDGRADLFALGVVLYEMLAGRRAFLRESAVETLNAILTDDPPDLTAARADLPPGLDRIVRHCLEKSPTQRFQSAQDVVFALEALSGTGVGTAVRPIAGVRARWSPVAVGAVAVAALSLAALAFGLWRSAPGAGDRVASPTFLALGAPHGRFFEHPSPAISPDGRRIAFWAPDADHVVRLFVRDLDRPTARALPGTDRPEVVGSEILLRPTFSPDGRSLLVFLDGRLTRVSVEGGSPQTLAEAASPRGVSWGVSGQVLYVPAVGGPLHLVPAEGGAPRPLTDAAPADDRRGGPRYPFFLPDGTHFLFSDLSRIYVASIEGGPARLLLEASSRAEYAQGHVLYVSEGSLMARPFDVTGLQFTGPPRRVAERVGSNMTSVVDSAFSVSAHGTLVYWGGRMVPMAEVVWLDRDGRRLRGVGEPGFYNSIAAAPGLSHVAIERVTASNAMETMVLEVARGVTTRVTLEAADRVAAVTPMYSRDGRHLWLAGVPGIFRTGPQGQSPELIVDRQAWVTDTSPDGRWLLYQVATPGAGTDVWALSMAPEAKAVSYLQTEAYEHFARFSPDTAWVAYVQDESGQPEVYVDAFPTKRERQRVSVTGGLWPMWSNDGRRLYFLTPAFRMMEVQVSRTGDDLRLTSPVELFQAPVPNGGFERPQYWPAPNGQFLFNARLDDALPRTLDVILDWPALLSR